MIMGDEIWFRPSLGAISLVLELGGLVGQHADGSQILQVLLPTILIQTDGGAGLALQVIGQQLKGLRITFSLNRWEKGKNLLVC